MCEEESWVDDFHEQYDEAHGPFDFNTIFEVDEALFAYADALQTEDKRRKERMMNYRLILFDVDGTLVTTKSGATFRETADDWQWIPGRLELCQKYVGASIALITNQGGVAFGYLKEDAMNWELDKTANAIAPYVPCFRCYTHPEATLPHYRKEDNRRKPGPGMILEAIEHFRGIGLHNTLMVGDRPEDKQAAKNAGVDFMWADEFFKI